ncbi:MAG: response regulator [Bryobacteraceae bacterium]|jgi:CheY-like chemotaxis protein
MPPRRTVLLVEDEAHFISTLEIAFDGDGEPRLTHTSTAEEALRILEATEIAAVITDIHLPSMDGFELIARLRGQPRFAGLPILVVSGDPDPASSERALSLGANAFFPKPYSPGAIRRKVKELIHAA